MKKEKNCLLQFVKCKMLWQHLPTKVAIVLVMFEALMQALKLVVDELKQLIVRVGGQLFGPFSDKIPVCSDKQDTATPPSYTIRPKIGGIGNGRQG